MIVRHAQARYYSSDNGRFVSADICKGMNVLPITFNPYDVWCFLIEFRMEVIGTGSIILMPIVMKRLVSRHPWKLKGSHQPVHSSDTDVDAIITLKDISNFVSTKAFMVIRIYMENKLRK